MVSWLSIFLALLSAIAPAQAWQAEPFYPVVSAASLAPIPTDFTPQKGLSYHNPNTGRFWTEDSYEGNGSDPSSLHKYTYCGNSPVNRLDQSGNSWIAEMGISAGIGTMMGAAVQSLSQGLSAYIDGLGWNEIGSAAAGGLKDGAQSGFLWGVAGFGVGKAIGAGTVWAFGRLSGGAQQWFGNAYSGVATAFQQFNTYLYRLNGALVNSAKNILGSFRTEAAAAAGDLEAMAERTLAKMELDNPGAHFFSRHGAQTTMDDQLLRATEGITPDGIAGDPSNASRFFTHQAQLDAANQATAIFQKTGQTRFPFEMQTTIGEGFLLSGKDYVVTANAFAVFKNGKLHTLYPLLKALP